MASCYSFSEVINKCLDDDQSPCSTSKFSAIGSKVRPYTRAGVITRWSTIDRPVLVCSISRDLTHLDDTKIQSEMRYLLVLVHLNFYSKATSVTQFDAFQISTRKQRAWLNLMPFSGTHWNHNVITITGSKQKASKYLLTFWRQQLSM